VNWSGSKLALLRLCGWAFAEDHVRNVPRPPHPALAGGSNAHAGLARLVQLAIDDEPLDVRAIAREVTAGNAAEFADVLGVLTLAQEELAGDPPLFEPRDVIYIETRLAMQLGPYTFDGQADLVEARGKTATVSDWKTHWRPESQDAFEADVQLPRYALLLDANHPGRFERFVLRKRFVRYRGAVRELVLERHQLELVKWDLVQEIEDAERRMAAGAFEATPGDWCTICSRTDACPRVREFLEHGLDLTLDDDVAARRAAETVRAIDAHSARLKARLKVYLGSDHPTGRVRLAGGSFGFGPARHKRASVSDVVEVFEAHDRPVNQRVLRVDVDELRRSLEREPGAVRRAMQAVVEEYETADCRYRRGDGLEDEEVQEEPTTGGT